MSIPLLMHVVNAIHHLMKIGPSYSFGEATSVSNKVEQFSTLRVLDHEGKTFYLFLIFIAKDGIGTHTDELD